MPSDNYRARARDAGRCANCPTPSTTWLCPSCQTKANIRHKRWRVRIGGEADRTPWPAVAPPLDCRACGGDGRQWDGAAFLREVCPECQGDGAAP